MNSSVDSCERSNSLMMLRWQSCGGRLVSWLLETLAASDVPATCRKDPTYAVQLAFCTVAERFMIGCIIAAAMQCHVLHLSAQTVHLCLLSIIGGIMQRAWCRQ